MQKMSKFFYFEIKLTHILPTNTWIFNHALSCQSFNFHGNKVLTSIYIICSIEVNIVEDLFMLLCSMQPISIEYVNGVIIGYLIITLVVFHCEVVQHLSHINTVTVGH